MGMKGATVSFGGSLLLGGIGVVLVVGVGVVVVMVVVVVVIVVIAAELFTIGVVSFRLGVGVVAS